MIDFDSKYVDDKNLIVYVHIGKNPSQTLIHFSSLAKERLPGTRFVLITDNPKVWEEFDGEIVYYDVQKRNKTFSKFVKRNKELKIIANGYWLYTLERIFALRELIERYPEEYSVIHFESDVLSFISPEILRAMKSNFDGVFVPRFSMDRGIASLLYSSSIKELGAFLERAQALIDSDSILVNDMNLLGRMLNTNQLGELPSGRDLNQLAIHSEMSVVFDGAAIGQYLLGQDALHTNNRVVSGFQNPDFPEKLSTRYWEIQNSKDFNFIVGKSPENKYFVASMHVHSKQIVPRLSPENFFWKQVIKEANNESPRNVGPLIEDKLHSSHLNLLTRIRVARKTGFLKVIFNKIKRLF